MRILLVEDDPDIARQLKQALADAGYAVDYAPDGEEAQFLGETEPYDAVILDLGLPKVDGVSVLERWRREGMASPVLILTARGGLEREGGGLRRRRRRLSDQALPYGGAAGPAARPAAPRHRPRRSRPWPAAACGSTPAPRAPASTASRCV